RIDSQLLVGPTFVTPSFSETADRIAALVTARIDLVVSLVERAELFADRKEIARYDDLWELAYFPVRDGEAPSRELMKEILDTIEGATSKGQRVYLHCVGGRGRSGCVAGCLFARRRLATGLTALNLLSKIRYEHGLFSPAPETDAQRLLVANWFPGE